MYKDGLMPCTMLPESALDGSGWRPPNLVKGLGTLSKRSLSQTVALGARLKTRLMVFSFSRHQKSSDLIQQENI